MFRCALLMYVLCGSVCMRTVLVYLTTESMRYRVFKGFLFGLFQVLGLVIGVLFCFP